MAGTHKDTGAPLDGIAHAFQSVEFLLSTRIGSLVLARDFGGGVAELLGRAVTPTLFAAYQQLIATAIDLWEPRFAVRRIVPSGTVDEIRSGRVGFRLEVDYRPRGHLGDFTVERVVLFDIGFRSGFVEVAA